MTLNCPLNVLKGYLMVGDAKIKAMDDWYEQVIEKAARLGFWEDVEHFKKEHRKFKEEHGLK